ncbi:EGF domain-specific O-linked N-acetylglucosamine transferase-like isoform X2 [Phalaenopsis equestris]|uniref:EGF domain-specific O-linked N-acetylglucosamine transferase-like isoform X2 n=1 Tax=Phalaenopsis equestris TaxID=78828 RepID=UPI0009E471E2|nr:EGF domain-specific O-linked N-acetylglucosamine transferase-like isoform X2 [Phalaenopsis equestris]
MKSKPYHSFSRIKAENLGRSAVLTFLLITIFFIAITKQTSHRPSPFLSFKVWGHGDVPCTKVKELKARSFTEKPAGDIGQEGRIVCDLSESRSDTCSMFGDIRVLSSSYTIFAAMSSESPIPLENHTHIIKPYARKWEPESMKNIKELSLKTSSKLQQNLTCNQNHAVPAIIFSTGGFLGNFFHDFTDVLIPLFVTSRQFNGNVQFLVTDFNAKWINKYRPILLGLSRFEVINMDIEKNIHCFPCVHVGLKSHRVLGIDPSKTPKGYTMSDFKRFLRESFSLKRSSIVGKKSRRKPRLLMILRKGSRSIMNEKEVIMMARRIGYKVITARPEEMKELTKFAEIVNSCDVMMGVHGAGLANMLFLPENSTVIQIIPLGGLTYACRHDFGEPAPDMGIKYLEYEIKDDESSLIKLYPRDHAVFKDPFSIHQQGWNQLWSIFLDKQMVKIDVGRFRVLLLEVYKSIKQ